MLSIVSRLGAVGAATTVVDLEHQEHAGGEDLVEAELVEELAPAPTPCTYVKNPSAAVDR